MNKKTLLGSIIAVAILVLVSFTGVVGYQTTSSTVTRASPLFSIRSRRAIDEESKDIVCDYVGKGEETNIHFSSRLKRTVQVQKAVDIISKMDDKAFSRFVARIIFRLKYQEQMNGKETLDVLQALYRIRENSNDMKDYLDDNPGDNTFEYLTCFWFPGCNIICKIIEILALTLLAILGWITSKTCYGYTFGTCCPD